MTKRKPRRSTTAEGVVKAAGRLLDRWNQGCTFQAYMLARMELEIAYAAHARVSRGGKR